MTFTSTQLNAKAQKEMKYNIVNFDDDTVLDIHLTLVRVQKTPKNRSTLRAMKVELALHFGRENIRHRELEAYLAKPENMVRLF